MLATLAPGADFLGAGSAFFARRGGKKWVLWLLALRKVSRFAKLRVGGFLREARGLLRW